MRHFIIVKWKDPAEMAGSTDAIQAIFDKTLDIEGIESVTLHKSCSDRANRHDLMIEIVMDPEALPAYDISAPHKEWKADYGDKILHKAIFDCE